MHYLLIYTIIYTIIQLYILYTWVREDQMWLAL